MKEQKTASEYIETVYGTSRFARTLAVGDTQSIVDLMQDFSDQQNAELRERVKELEGLLTIWVKQNNYLRRHSISDFDEVHDQTKKTLKK